MQVLEEVEKLNLALLSLFSTTGSLCIQSIISHINRNWIGSWAQQFIIITYSDVRGLLLGVPILLWPNLYFPFFFSSLPPFICFPLSIPPKYITWHPLPADIQNVYTQTVKNVNFNVSSAALKALHKMALACLQTLAFYYLCKWGLILVSKYHKSCPTPLSFLCFCGADSQTQNDLWFLFY